MVQAAEADVVRPAVAADDPDRLAHQGVGDRDRAGPPAAPAASPSVPASAARRCFSESTRAPLGEDRLLVRLLGVEDGRGEGFADRRRQRLEQRAGRPLLRLETQPDAQAELGVVLEERVGPRRSPALAVGGPGGGGQVAPVDGGAAGRVGHQQAIAEELGEQLEVGGLAATGAGPGELEERLEDRGPLDRVVGEQAPVELGDGPEEVPAGALGVAVLEDGLQVERLVPGLGLGPARADLDAEAAAGAVVGGHLDGQQMTGELLGAEGLGEESRGSRLDGLGSEDLHPDRRVRADDRALPAVAADGGIPDRDLGGDGPLLEARGPRGEAAVGRHRRDRQGLAPVGDQLAR